MKTKMKNASKFLAMAFVALSAISSLKAQMPYNCPSCVPLASRDIVRLSTLADANGNLVAGHTLLTSDHIYLLDKKIYVPSGDTLTILPGTVIKGEPSADAAGANALIVTRGGKIFARGSECAPIIFTALEDPLDGTYCMTNTEKWGGVIILGYAQNNVAAGELNAENPNYVVGGTTVGMAAIEGVSSADPRNWYGAEGAAFNNADNSGVFSYVSIRHGGAILGANNEINGLTLGSVGSGTTINHVEVVSNGDDGIECFGGAVNLKYIRVMYCQDDYIDWDQGYIGKIQYMVGVQLPGTPAYGDNGFECDGDDGNDYVRPFLSHPIISNVTILGNDADGATSGDVALELKERDASEIYNSLFANFYTGIKRTASTPNATGEMPTSIVENNTFISCNNFWSGGVAPSSTNTNVTSLSGFDADYVIPCPTVSTNSYDIKPQSTAGTYTINDPFFDVTSYRGAINPSYGVWWNMSACDDLGEGSVPVVDFASNSSVSCKADQNGDGVISVVDLNAVLSAYGSNCMQ